MRTDPSCRSAREGLALFLSGDLPRERDAWLRQHLIACVACRRELRAWMDLDRAFRSATGPEVPPPDSVASCSVAPDGRSADDSGRGGSGAGDLRVDDAFFDDLRRRVLAAVAAPRPPRLRVGGAVAAAALFAVGFGLVAFLQRGDPRIPAWRPDTTASEPPPTALDSGVSLRPVGLRSESWTGLQGRASADALVDRTLLVPLVQDRTRPARTSADEADPDGGQVGGAGPATQPLPLRERRPIRTR